MLYDHERCREVLFRSLIDGISTHMELIRELETEQRKPWQSGLRAISYDIIPWQPFVAVSFCTASDDWSQIRWSPTDDCWTGYNLIGFHNAEQSLSPALEYVHDIYNRKECDSFREMHHLILLATADALLDPEVAELLKQCNIPTEPIKDQFPARVSPYFEYVVVDEDRTFSGNYCEMLCAHRIARRLLDK